MITSDQILQLLSLSIAAAQLAQKGMNGEEVTEEDWDAVNKGREAAEAMWKAAGE